MLPAAEQLAPFARVHAPDLPGFGRSAKPSRVLDVPALADALAAWMDAVELERAALVANSFGCQVVVDLAVRHGERVERIVLNGPTIDPQGPSVARQIGRLLRDGRYEPPSLLLVLARDYRDAGARRLVRTFLYALRDPIAEKLPRVRAPALVVRGGRDPIVPQRWAEEATRLLPSGRLVVVPGVGHAVNYAAPHELARIVLRFLEE
jgi:2-hydroxy-6-oxonona-2,4-dienedioate hydrolase